MLHALLHGKLDESLPEPQRREDALTSTVFGTLVWVNALDIVGQWLRLNTPIGGLLTDAWFWPRLAFAEPDVVLRFGQFVIFVEAKYRSDRHDAVSDDEDEDACDQLVRQYRSATLSPERRARYAEALEQALAECKLVQVFLVDARRLRRARREYEESLGRLPSETDLRLVSWQSLFRLLSDADRASLPWARDLRAYFRMCGLDTFDGFGRSLALAADLAPARRWRAERDTGRLHLAAEIASSAGAALLRRWVVGGHRSRRIGIGNWSLRCRELVVALPRWRNGANETSGGIDPSRKGEAQ